MARSSRSKPRAPVPSINNKDLSFLEGALAGLPSGPVTDGDAHTHADGLLKFGYHQNPYMRMFTKSLWSGYAISRGRIVECDQRFKQAHRDAQMSNIDNVTIRALDDAAGALEQALAPDGSVAAFLDEMRSRTLRRMWSRVCETSHLPPPSFSKIFGGCGDMTLEEMEAADAAEMAALMLDNGEDEEAAQADDAETAAAPADTAAEADATAEADAAAEAGTATEAGAPPPLPTLESAPPEAVAAEPANQDQVSEAANVSFAVEVSREGPVNLGPELLLSAASEALKELRVRRPEGGLQITISVTGTGRERQRGRRSRRRRN